MGATRAAFRFRPKKEDLPEGCGDVMPGKFPYTRGNKACNCWLVRQDIKAGDAAEANARAKALIAQGVDSIAFGIKGKLVTPEYIPALLDGIDAESVELNFNVCVGKVQLFTQLLVEYYRHRAFNLEKVRGSIGYDPIGKEMLVDMYGYQKEPRVVCGVYKTLPANTSLGEFDYFFLRPIREGSTEDGVRLADLGSDSFWGLSTNIYFKLRKDARIEDVERNLAEICKRHKEYIETLELSFHLVPLKDNYFKDNNVHKTQMLLSIVGILALGSLTLRNLCGDVVSR